MHTVIKISHLTMPIFRAWNVMEFERYTHNTLHKFNILLHMCNYTKIKAKI